MWRAVGAHGSWRLRGVPGAGVRGRGTRREILTGLCSHYTRFGGALCSAFAATLWLRHTATRFSSMSGFAVRGAHTHTDDTASNRNPWCASRCWDLGVGAVGPHPGLSHAVLVSSGRSQCSKERRLIATKVTAWIWTSMDRKRWLGPGSMTGSAVLSARSRGTA